jgi:nicotinamidase-related amidase
MSVKQLPLPDHFDPDKVGEIWSVQYETILAEAKKWAESHQLLVAANHKFRLALMIIDGQIDFCVPGQALFVGGQSGTGAVDDNKRLCNFIYHNLGVITKIFATMDTHRAFAIFHPFFWVDGNKQHPAPHTVISVDDVERGKWEVNPAVAPDLAKGNYALLKNFALHYVRSLAEKGKYQLTIWPHHTMLGGIGHALVPSLEEALLFHSMALASLTEFEIKGGNPLTENYSVLVPEVTTGSNGEAIAQRNVDFLRKLLEYDAVVIAGQAKSHCVAWTIDDLLDWIMGEDHSLVEKVYLLEDCSSPVVVPGVVDFTDQANEAFQRFADAGMHVVKSLDPIDTWSGIRL